MRRTMLIILLTIAIIGRLLSQDLVEAVKVHDVERVKTLLASGQDVDQKGKDGIPSIVWATASGDTTIVTLLMRK